MIRYSAVLTAILVFSGCMPRPMALNHDFPQTYLQKESFALPEDGNDVSYDTMLTHFRNDCRSQKAKKLYGALCDQATAVSDAEAFFRNAFDLYRVVHENGDGVGLVTGYYEPLLYGSTERTGRYRYALYREPDDLINVELASIYPELKGKRVRGRLVGRKIVPYLTREEMLKSDTEAICWVDDRVERFFLEVQGSGRVELEGGETIYVGYANQNGHPYRSIGKYLVEKGEIPAEKISLQSIRAWLDANPERVDEVLNHNPSSVFFRQKNVPATGALGLEFTPGHSVAVDPQFIPPGAMLYMQTNDPVTEAPLHRIVFAQDTGGAIKGTLRADLFWGYGKEAEQKAGKMQEELRLWIFLPKGPGDAMLASKITKP